MTRLLSLSRDLAALAAVFLVIYGLWSLYSPLAYIGAGLALAAFVYHYTPPPPAGDSGK